MSKRGWLFLGTALLFLALFGLLAWAQVKSGGNPGVLGTNSEFGEVRVEPEKAHQFTLELLDGTSLSLSDLQGEVVLVDFWASWCTPCRQEAPALAEVYREYLGRGVEFVGVNIWDREGDARDYMNHFNVPYPNGVDTQGTIAIDYGVRGIPEKFLINRRGVVVKKLVGPVDVESLSSILDGLLGAAVADDQENEG